jgi:acyl carrier protein
MQQPAVLNIYCGKVPLPDPNQHARPIEECSPFMDNVQVYARLTDIFHEVFDDDSIKVTPELSAADVDGWDSLTHIRLILTVEKAFKVKFSTSEIGKLKNVGDLVDLISAQAQPR